VIDSLARIVDKDNKYDYSYSIVLLYSTQGSLYTYIHVYKYIYIYILCIVIQYNKQCNRNISYVCIMSHVGWVSQHQ
jgi:hypothetical protein